MDWSRCSAVVVRETLPEGEVEGPANPRCDDIRVVPNIEAHFLGHVRLGRELHHEGFFPEACDEFSLAFGAWSERLDPVIDHGMREAGTRACGAGRVMEGSTRFVKAVRKFSSN